MNVKFRNDKKMAWRLIVWIATNKLKHFSDKACAKTVVKKLLERRYVTFNSWSIFQATRYTFWWTCNSAKFIFPEVLLAIWLHRVYRRSIIGFVWANPSGLWRQETLGCTRWMKLKTKKKVTMDEIYLRRKKARHFICANFSWNIYFFFSKSFIIDEQLDEEK